MRMPAPDDRSRGRRPSGGRSGKPEPRGARPPAQRGGKPDSRGSGKPAPRGGKPDSRGGGKPEQRSTSKPPQRGGKPSYDRDTSKDRTRSTAGRWRRDDLPEVARTTAQAEYDGPPIPDDITGKELDPHVLAQLKSLPEKLAARVARHLVAAAQLMDIDPETAYKHTLAARARASRVAVVREASGEAAYAAGKFKEALTEFKAARRMNHNGMYLPMMADCERGLGRPERALALAKDPQVIELDETGQIEMRIVESGARRDLGDPTAAIRVLEGRELRSRSRAAWVPRLRYAYAEALLADGQVAAAREWFERAAGVDIDGYTDAAERLEALDADGSV
jgi:hypothetical protein